MKAYIWIVLALTWVASPTVLDQGFWLWMGGLIVLMGLSAIFIPGWWRVTDDRKMAENWLEHLRRTVTQEGVPPGWVRRVKSSGSSVPWTGPARGRWLWPDASQGPTTTPRRGRTPGTGARSSSDPSTPGGSPRTGGTGRWTD